MSFVIQTTPFAPGRIAYHNLFRDSGATVTASDETAGWEKENAYDLNLIDKWQPSAAGTHYLEASFASAQYANYMAISCNHNLHKVGGTAKPIYSTDGGDTWNDAAGAVSVVTDRTILIMFDSIPAAKWRVHITTTTGAPIIAMAMIGEIMEFPRKFKPGLTPTTMARNNKVESVKSGEGYPVGGTIRYRNLKTKIKLDRLAPEWVDTSWEPFMDYAEQSYPFIFSWDSEQHSDQAVTAWVPDGSKLPHPTYSTPRLMQVSLPIEAKR